MHTFEAPDRDNYNVDEDDIDDYYPTRADLSDIQQQYHERIEAAQERLRDLVGRLLQLRNLLLTDFTYVGPQREVGRYVYDLASGSEGTKLAATLGRRPEIVNKCNAMLRALEVPYAVHADILTTKMGTRLVEVLLEDLRSGPSEGVRKGLPNVGFGVTQLLYIVAALVEHGRGPDGVAPGDVRLPGFEKWPYLLVEQPELHLHPRWQANLASLFCGTAWPQRPDDETVFDRCNLILETHSEHLMLRLQRLVRNGKVAPGEVVINVLEQHDGSGTTKVTPIALAPDGELSVIWPGGFFTERDVELYG